MTTPHRLSGYLKSRPVPGVTSYGVWTPFTWDNKGSVQHGLTLEPTRAPWRELFQFLDAAPLVEDRPIDVREEAAAIVAACWRYGTYLHVLTEGETYAPFQQDPGLSRIRDDEMRRIQLEFSSALAQWLLDRERDPEQVRRRVLAARQLLPGVPLPSIGPYSLEEVSNRRATRLELMLSAFEEPAAEPVSVQDSMRHEANYAVNRYYRNGEAGHVLEDLHAGTWSLGREVPGYKRLYGGELAAIMRPLTRHLTFHLAARTLLAFPENLAHLRHLAPRDWSTTLDTGEVTFHGLPGYGPLDPRLAALALKNPTVYGHSG